MRVGHIGGRLGTAVALGVAAVLALASAGTSQAADPVVVLDRSGTAAGESMLVTGAGWEPGATLIVELCGRGGLGGSTDCDVPHQATAGVGPGGRFSVELEVGKPPSPCPCVVKAMDQESRLAATAAIAVAGIPTVPITQDDAVVPTRAIEVSELELRGGRWPELFGAGGRRWLDITLVNTGAVTVKNPELSIAWGSGSHPTGFVAPPEIEAMAPGETQELTISLDRPMFALGDHTALVEVQGVGAEPVIARTSMTGYPWGLLAVALLVLQLLLLRLRNHLRRRLGRRRPAAPTGASALPAPPLALAPATTDEDRPPTVIDLDAELEPPVPSFPVYDENGPSGRDEERESSGSAPADGADGALGSSAHHEAAMDPDPSEQALVADLAVVHLDEAGRGQLVPIGDSGNGSRRQAYLNRSQNPDRDREPGDRAASRHEQDEAHGRPAPNEPASRERLLEAEQRLAAVEADGGADVLRARERAADLEATAGERVREAEARHEEELELLDAVWRRANELVALSEAALFARREEIAAELEDARRAVTAAEAAQAARVEAARLELVEAQAIEAEAATHALARDADADRGAPSRRAPRIGDIDQRMARAVERALASMGRDSAN